MTAPAKKAYRPGMSQRRLRAALYAIESILDHSSPPHPGGVTTDDLHGAYRALEARLLPDKETTP